MPIARLTILRMSAPLRSILFAVTVIGLAGCASGTRSSSPASGNEPSLALSTSSDIANGEAITTSEAIARDPDLLVTRTPWEFRQAEGWLITTPHYRLWTTVSYQNLISDLPVFYERSLEHYTTALADLPMPQRRLDTYLFQSRSQWQAKTAEMLPDQADMFANLGRGGYTTLGTSVKYYIDRGVWTRHTFAIAAHEGWHQYTQQTFKHQLPIWLEEGVATYMEGYRYDRGREQLPEFSPTSNRERRQTLSDAVRRDQLISLDALLTRTPQAFLNESKDSLLTYYAQVWALTRFLAEAEDGRYRNSLAVVLLDAAEGRLVGRMAVSDYLPKRRGSAFSGRVGPAVVQEYFNPDLAAFEAEYLAFIDQILQQARTDGRGR